MHSEGFPRVRLRINCRDGTAFQKSHCIWFSRAVAFGILCRALASTSSVDYKPTRVVNTSVFATNLVGLLSELVVIEFALLWLLLFCCRVVAAAKEVTEEDSGDPLRVYLSLIHI